MKRYNLRTLRINNNLSQLEMAHRLDVKQGTYSKYERGLVELSPEKKKLIIKLFKLNKKETFQCKKEDPFEGLIKLENSMMDDRVCMHYVVDRLEDIVETYEKKDVTEAIKQIEDFKRECIYNLGVNTRIRRKGED